MTRTPIGGVRPRYRRAAGCVALLVLVALIPACSPSHGKAHAAPSTTTEAAATTTEPAPQYAPSPYSWDRSTDASLALGGGASATLSAVLAPQLSGTWQLFGSRLDRTGSPAATVWSSPDGTSWTSSALDPPTEPGRALAAAQYRAATVVVGATGVGSDQQAAVWLAGTPGGPYAPQSVPSSDGASWMNLVTAGSLGMFATGRVDGRFAMWTSTNGRTWSESTGAEKVITASPGAEVNALLAEGDFVYAAGSIQSGTTIEAAVWSTSNGLDWHLVSSAGPSFSGPGNRAIYSLASLQSGLVAAGAVQEGGVWLPASWISPDGQSWSLPSTDFPGTPAAPRAGLSYGPSGGSAVRSVSSVPTLTGATALVATGGGPYGQALWQSTDGIHWTSVSMPAVAASATSWRAEAVAATTGDVVVMDAEPGQPYMLSYREPSPAGPGHAAEAAQWTEPSANPLTFGPIQPEAVPVSLRTVQGRLALAVEVVRRPQVIGPAATSMSVLWSTDGTDWASSTPPGTSLSSVTPATVPAAGVLTARLPGGWVAVASAASSTPLVWTSPTGLSWDARTVLHAAGSAAGPAHGATSGPSSSVSATTAPGTAGATAQPAGVNGLCTARLAATAAQPAHEVVVAVGSATAAAPADDDAPGAGSGGASVITRSAAAWESTTGSSWRAAAVIPPPPSGGTQTMIGCLTVGSTLVAFGSTTGPGGSPQPALWRSPDGSSWTRVGVNEFNTGTPQPLVSVSEHDNHWLAAADPDPWADPVSSAPAGAPGPAASAGSDVGVGPSASLQDGRSGLWLAAGNATAWQLVDTATAPWLGADQSQIDLVGFAPTATATAAGGEVHATTTSGPTTAPPSGSSTTATTGAAGTATAVPVVVGVVDGRLAVWTGTSS